MLRLPTPSQPLARLPAHLLNGLSVGLGLVLATGLVASLGGWQAAMSASSGAAAVCVADTVVPARHKWRQMLPAWLSSAVVAALVALAYAAGPATELWLALVVVAVTFTSVMWMAWGKRGGPQTFVMLLTLVFQIAAHTSPTAHTANTAALAAATVASVPPAHPDSSAWMHWLWVVSGSGLLCLWSLLSASGLAPRYRTLALAECLRAVAQLMRAQATWMQGLLHTPSGSTDLALLNLVRQQTTMAEPLQQARDLLYSLPPGHAHQSLVAALFRVVDMRDQVLACQLDLDTLVRGHIGYAAVPHFARAMFALSDDLLALAHALQTQQAVPPPRPIDAELLAMYASAEAAHAKGLLEHWPSSGAAPLQDDAAAPAPASDPQGSSLAFIQALHTRVTHIQRSRSEIGAALNGRPQSLPVPLQGLRTFISPSRWPLSALRAQLKWRSPVLRYALRATLAMGCTDLLAPLLPWATHRHWLLLTVAVVMRGSLEQTLLRRNARIIGTLVGCLLATLLLQATQSPWLIFAVLALAASLAHAYTLVDYRITAAAGSVLALLQSQLLLAGSPSTQVLALERLADTAIGAGIAWAFSYVLPAWEREQLPSAVRQLLKAQADYARQVLSLRKRSATDRAWRNARRDVYDALWLLTQTLQRMSKEPERVRSAVQQLETVLVHSHRLTSHIAAIKTMLTVRRDVLHSSAVMRALAGAEQAVPGLLMQTPRAEPPSAENAAPGLVRQASDQAGVGELPSVPLSDPQTHPEPWLLRRLKLTTDEAQRLAWAAAQVQS